MIVSEIVVIGDSSSSPYEAGTLSGTAHANTLALVLVILMLVYWMVTFGVVGIQVCFHIRYPNLRDVQAGGYNYWPEVVTELLAIVLTVLFAFGIPLSILAASRYSKQVNMAKEIAARDETQGERVFETYGAK